MGSVFKKAVTKPLPAGAEVVERQGQRLARWKDRRGKTRTAPLTANGRVAVAAGKWYAKYRDGAGVVRVVPTGCRDETAARRVLADLERKAELVRSGVMTTAEAVIGGHQTTPLAEHFATFDQYLRAKGDSAIHRSYTGRYFRRPAAECSFATLADLRREALERWLAARGDEGVAAKARNHYRNALVTFCNWCVATDRLTANPFDAIPKANEEADRRRLRRSLEENELVRL